MREEREWRVEAGQYLGEISALCFLKVPPHFSSLPYLLAGTGSQLLLFDIDHGRQIESFYIFEGVRVHGIAAQLIKHDGNSLPSSVTFNIVVSGERRVKLYKLCLHLRSISVEPPSVSTDLVLLKLLPRFTHWILDICFLADGLSSEDGSQYLAVGCSDNSVHVWSILNSNLIFEVRCLERCLLYSMRLWGNDIESLHIASGTIFNKIVVWKLVRKHATLSSTSTGKEPNMLRNLGEIQLIDSYYYEAHIVSRLSGHQGSIFCLSWSSDGSKLVSTSDDRSARMWIADGEMNTSNKTRKFLGPYLAGPTLFGHGARVWDCCISDSLIVTAGEDCTCRVWGLDGQELQVIKEHLGRGVWRCLYDPDVSLVVTAGFDSAIKAHRLLASSSGFLGKSMKEVNERREEVFRTCIPNLSGHFRLMDSKSEYVRCLKFVREDTIYVATNRGYVYHGKVSGSGFEWTELLTPMAEVPIICLDVLSTNLQELPLGVEDWVAVGDGKGVMKVVKVIFSDYTPQVAVTISWSAEMERQLLGAYWCRSLGSRFILTSNPKGLVKLWKWSDSLSPDTIRESGVHLVADFMSPFGARVMCLDASCEEEVLVCGDLRGNLVLFPLAECMLTDNSPQSFEKTHVQTYFKGAHGISTVSSISIARFSSNLTEIRSTGADGCICYLEYDRDRQLVEFVGMKQIKELSLVESVSTDHCPMDDSASSSYAVGFSSTDFLIWNLHSETKLLQVKCGGWRRPHSYYLGRKPEMCCSFAYVKDEVIYVHRYSVPDGKKNFFPRNLHLQFHGREIHCLCIIPEVFQSSENGNPKSSWITTGCEDGTVRLTRYRPGSENWSTSNLLGEHVGGSAVRSLCFVSEVHSAETKGVEATHGTFRENGLVENVENPCLLISVGAKRVLTSWLLRNRQMIGGDGSTNGLWKTKGALTSTSEDASLISFKWLSTDMPTKGVRAPKNMQDSVKTSAKVPASMPVSNAMEAEQTQHRDTHENDWRYLSVTAFLVGAAHSRLTVCFVVVSCSDATLTLRALVLPYRYWFDVACLAPLSSPVLALQHVVIPLQLPYPGDMVSKSAYIVVSGSTDGSIAFWDLSDSVEAFMLRISSLHVEKSIDFQKRPRTGRGSQGGRWWRSISAVKCENKVSEASNAVNGKSISTGDNKGTLDYSSLSMTSKEETISSSATETACDGSVERFSNSADRFSEVKPLHVLKNVHQSGVNCLHICHQSIGNGSQYSIISGGDDQALNFLQFILSPAPMRSNLDMVLAIGTVSESETAGQTMLNYSNESYSIIFLCQNKAPSAHSSAVKGVWTNGVWVFSTGLDQRIRCWKLTEHGNLTEHGHFITSVPEPEALDVRDCGRNCYQVMVAGRGMQMVEFFVS